jgi:hypothetical protein
MMQFLRRSFWLQLAFGLAWFLVCFATLRPDRPASILLHYCAQAGGLLSCQRQPTEILVPPPNIDIAERDLVFFAFIGFGTPLLVFAMGRAARWAASGGTDD